MTNREREKPVLGEVVHGNADLAGLDVPSLRLSISVAHSINKREGGSMEVEMDELLRLAAIALHVPDFGLASR